MEVLDYTKLTDEQKQQIRQQMEAEDKAKSDREKQVREDYESLKEQQVLATFKRLTQVSSAIEEEKVDIFNQFGSLLALKKELYNLSDEQMEFQQSHTFTSKDGRVSIIIGSNVIDRWSDDVAVGIDRVNNWISNRIADKTARDIIIDLLKPNDKGVLKANRVLELSRKAAEIGDNELVDAVNFIRDQYRPEKTSTYVKARYKDEDDRWQWLALSMSAV